MGPIALTYHSAKIAVVLAVVLLALAACQTASGSFCRITEINRPSQATIDAMTDAEVERALAQLEKGRRLCGWAR